MHVSVLLYLILECPKERFCLLRVEGVAISLGQGGESLTLLWRKRYLSTRMRQRQWEFSERVPLAC